MNDCEADFAKRQPALHAKGRGAQVHPPNRFLKLHFEEDLGHLEHDPDAREARERIPTEYFVDQSQTIVTENDSPDVGFRYSLNPYRGCAHGCSYCYARPTHEYLGWNAGLDFETKVLVKPEAAELLRRWLSRPDWTPEPITLSGVTDCYQPIERVLRLTRSCVEVAWEFRQPITIVTKNALVCRDRDILRQMAGEQLVSVAVSVTTLDQGLARVMEPRTSSPQARLEAIEKLAAAGIPTHAMVAPVIPGLNDQEIPAILQAVQRAGASSASYVLLRLPLTVRPVFLDWLSHRLPEKAERIVSAIRQTREGGLNDARFGSRMRGRGPRAAIIRRTFDVFCQRLGLDGRIPELDVHRFRRPGQLRQLRMF